MTRRLAVSIAIALSLIVGCGSPATSLPVAVSGDHIGALQARVAVRLIEPAPQPGDTAEAYVSVWAYEPTSDVTLSVTAQRQGRDPVVVGSHFWASLSPDDTLGVRVAIPFEAGRYTLRASIEGLPNEGTGREGVAAYLYLLVYDDATFVSTGSIIHARRDSLNAHRGPLGRLLGLGSESLTTEQIGTVD